MLLVKPKAMIFFSTIKAANHGKRIAHISKLFPVLDRFGIFYSLPPLSTQRHVSSFMNFKDFNDQARTPTNQNSAGTSATSSAAQPRGTGHQFDGHEGISIAPGIACLAKEQTIPMRLLNIPHRFMVLGMTSIFGLSPLFETHCGYMDNTWQQRSLDQHLNISQHISTI